MAESPTISRVGPLKMPQAQENTGHFQQGHRGGPGRPRREPDRSKADLSQLIMTAAVQTGFIRKNKDGIPEGTGEEGCLGYLKWAAIFEPRTYLALMALASPLQISVRPSMAVVVRIRVGEPQRFAGLPCVRPVADYLRCVAGLGVFSARAFMIVIAGRSLAPAHVGRTPGLCHALAVGLLLGLFGFAIGGIEGFGAGEHSKCEIVRACKHGAGLGKTSARKVGFSLAHSTAKCNGESFGVEENLTRSW
jgi:hypothetical protein